MQKLARTFACFVLLFVPVGLTAQNETQISSSQIQEYLRDALEKYGEPNSSVWPQRMYRGLVKAGDADATARSLAQEDGIPASIEKALMAFWFAYSETFHGRQTSDQREATRQRLWQRGLGIVRASGHHSIVIGVVVSATMGRPHCEVENFDALLTGAPNMYQSGITAAQTAGCTSWWLALHQRFPKDAAILTTLSRDRNDLRLATRLAFLQALGRRNPASQEARLNQIREHVTALWEAGLVSEGFAILNSAPRRDLQILLNAQPSPDHSNDFRIEYIAALYVSGRAREAGAEFGRLPYTKQFRSLWNCSAARVLAVPENQATDPCAGIASQVGAKWQLLESLLNRRDEDPYPLIEGGADT